MEVGERYLVRADTLTEKLKCTLQSIDEDGNVSVQVDNEPDVMSGNSDQLIAPVLDSFIKSQIAILRVILLALIVSSRTLVHL
eukprot:UN28159